MRRMLSLVFLVVGTVILAFILVVRPHVCDAAIAQSPARRTHVSSGIAMVGRMTYRKATRQIRKYQKRLRACSSTSGMNIWYLIHHTIQTPSSGDHRLDVSLNSEVRSLR